jgi:NADH-quinone oxidoreductase subunit C
LLNPDQVIFAEINDLLVSNFGPEAFSVNTTNPQPYLTVPVEHLVELCQFLRDDDRLFFDLLACVTAIDNGPEVNTMEVVYNLTSIPYEHNLMFKVVVPRNAAGQPLPVVPSVAHIWRTADWHEREAYDLVGINFTGHPDLRRILMPTDWNGHPLRGDYKEEEQYHGIRTT